VGVWSSFSLKQGRIGKRGRPDRRGADGGGGRGVRPGRWRGGHARGSMSPGGFPLGRRAGVMMLSSGVRPTSRGVRTPRGRQCTPAAARRCGRGQSVMSPV
jgi:hypothetical protein